MPKGLLLLSGGFDSGVAGHMFLKKGFEVVAVHFSQEPFDSCVPKEKAIELSKKIGIKHLIVVPVGEHFAKLSSALDHKMYFVLIKRFMYRASEIIAKEESCDFLITGENLGQVSSQTLPNLRTISNSVKIPVLKPLLSFDKKEIIDIAQEIGTFEISKGPEFCNVLGPLHPNTKTENTDVETEEKKIDLEKMIKEAIKKKEVYKF